MHTIKPSFLFIILTVLLSACGGGGGEPRVNSAPVVNAGLAQNVVEETSVTLDGAATDSDGSISSYAWTQITGPMVTLSNVDSAIATFTAPNIGFESSVAFTFRLTATDDEGATGSDNTIVTVNTSNIAPVANAGSDQVVNEQTIVSLDGSLSSDTETNVASFGWSQTSGQTVTITNANTATPSFIAPSLSTSATLVFALTVTDVRSATATDSVTITVNPVAGLNDAPIANAGSDIASSSNQTVVLDGTASNDVDGSIASYVWVQIAGAAVTMNNSTSANAEFTAPVVMVDTTYTFELTVTDNEGVSASDSVDVVVSPPITITGTATYDNVSHTTESGLDYNNISQDPIRGAVVEVISGASTVLVTGVTDSAGNYSLEVPQNSGTVFVRVKAQALLDDTLSWDAKVVDNTNSQALYALDGSSFTVGTTDIARPTLNAGSGWTGSSYGGTRAAGPFHILDRVMDGHLKLQSIDPNIILPTVEINWSPNNNSSSTGNDLVDLRNGDIGGTFFIDLPTGFQEFSGSQIFVLGAEDQDTDEYDGHVIVHEWGHYFEKVLSRSDNIGGPHGRRDRLDMRVAFSEGFANAWSAIITDDTVYRDAFDTSQALGFDFDMELNSWINPGWYSERSIQSLVYDIYDSINDGPDAVSLGLLPIYNVLVGQQKNTQAFTSIYTFAEYFRQENPASVGGINTLLSAQSIDGSDIWGINESNDAGATPSTLVLPVYTELIVDGVSQQVCSTDDYDTAGESNDFSVDGGNKLSVYRFIRFTLPTTADYRFTISAPSTTADPAMILYLNGVEIGFIDNVGDGSAENAVGNLEAGNYTAVVYEYDNSNDIGSLITTGSSDECFDVQISTP